MTKRIRALLRVGNLREPAFSSEGFNQFGTSKNQDMFFVTRWYKLAGYTIFFKVNAYENEVQKQVMAIEVSTPVTFEMFGVKIIHIANRQEPHRFVFAQSTKE